MISPIPDTMSLINGASFGMAAQTAYEAVVINGKLTKGKRILILGMHVYILCILYVCDGFYGLFDVNQLKSSWKIQIIQQNHIYIFHI